MTKKGNLFYLIKALSKSEKRYFKLFCISQKGDNNYWRLFEAIDAQEEFDEEELKKKFDGEAFVKQLHVTKNYLYKLILSSLRQYHSKISKDAELKDLLRNIEILFIKELYDQCHYEIQKAEKMARQYEKSTALIEVLGWKRRLQMALRRVKMSELAEFVQASKSAIQNLQQINDYWDLTAHIFDYADDEQVLFWQHPALKNDKQCPPSIRAAVLHHHAFYTYYSLNNAGVKGKEHLLQLIDLLEKHPERIKDDPAAYVTALNNLVSFYIFNKSYEKVPFLLQKVKAIPKRFGLKKESKFTIRLHLRTYNIELEMYRDTQNLKAGIALITEIEAFLEQRQKIIPNHYKLKFWYQFAYIYFLHQDFYQAMHWVNEIVGQRFDLEGPNKELETFARLLNLMVHFELGNIIVLKYAVDSCRRFLKKKKQIEPFEDILLRFFSKITKVPKAEYRACFEHLKMDLLDGETPMVNPHILDYLDFKSWILAKL